MRDLEERVQRDNSVAASTVSHVPRYTEDDVEVIEQVYRGNPEEEEAQVDRGNPVGEEAEVDDDVDREIICVLNGGVSGGGVSGGGGSRIGSDGDTPFVVANLR